MTALRPKRLRRQGIGAAIPLAICAIMIAAAANVVAYDRMTDIRREIAMERAALGAARAENADPVARRESGDAVRCRQTTAGKVVGHQKNH